jgi:hypothetical protein
MLKTWLRAFATSGALVMVIVIVTVMVMVMVKYKRRPLSAHHHQTYMHT